MYKYTLQQTLVSLRPAFILCSHKILKITKYDNTDTPAKVGIQNVFGLRYP